MSDFVLDGKRWINSPSLWWVKDIIIKLIKGSRMSVLCLGWECMGHGKRAKDEHGGKNKVVGRSQILGDL